MSRGEFISFALLALVVGWLVVSNRGGNSGEEPVPLGTPMPPLMAEGWLNTEESVSPDALAGKVVVVDCWATWCPPCRAAMPELSRLYAAYNPLGVKFLGLTSETEQEVPAIEKFVSKIDGFDWPVGYGSGPMLDMLGIRVLPTVIVFGPEGTVVWSGHHLDDVEAVLDRLLASK